MNKVKFLLLLSCIACSVDIKSSESEDEDYCNIDISGKEQVMNLGISVLFKEDTNPIEPLCNQSEYIQVSPETSVQHNDLFQEDLDFIKKVTICLETVGALHGNAQFHPWSSAHVEDAIKLLNIDKLNTKEEVCSALKALFFKIEAIKVGQKDFHDLDRINAIFIYSGRLINLIHKFKLKGSESKKALLILQKTKEDIIKKMIELGLNKNKKALKFLKNNLVPMSKKDYKIIVDYLNS